MLTTLKSTLEISNDIAVLSPSEGVRREDGIARGIAAIVGPGLMVYIAMTRPFTTLDIGIPASGAWDVVGFCAGLLVFCVSIVGLRRGSWVFDLSKGTATFGNRVRFRLSDVKMVVVRWNKPCDVAQSWTLYARVGVKRNRYIVDAVDPDDADNLAKGLADFLSVPIQRL